MMMFIKVWKPSLVIRISTCQVWWKKRWETSLWTCAPLSKAIVVTISCASWAILYAKCSNDNWNTCVVGWTNNQGPALWPAHEWKRAHMIYEGMFTKSEANSCSYRWFAKKTYNWKSDWTIKLSKGETWKWTTWDNRAQAFRTTIWNKEVSFQHVLLHLEQ